MPVPPRPADEAHDRHDHVRLILLLLAREAALDPEQVDGPVARTLLRRGVARGVTSAGRGRRPWTCVHRWTA